MLESFIFDNFQDAFYYCKRENKTIIAIVNEQRWRLYPNGNAEPLSDKSDVTVNLVFEFGDQTYWTQYYWDPDKQELIERDFRGKKEDSEENTE